MVEGFWLSNTFALSPETSSLLCSSSGYNSTPHTPKPPHTAQLVIFLLSLYFSRENSQSLPFPDDTPHLRINYNYPLISSESPIPHISQLQVFTQICKSGVRKFPTLHCPQRSFSLSQCCPCLFHSAYSTSFSLPLSPLPTSPSCAHTVQTSSTSSVDKPAGYDKPSSISK